MPVGLYGQANATSHGIFIRGANAENAFSVVASLESDGLWYGAQLSIGATPAYAATLRFGAAGPGGVHSAVGFDTAPHSDGSQATFRAEHSGVGCDAGAAGAATACEQVCTNVGLPWAQIQARCVAK